MSPGRGAEGPGGSLRQNWRIWGGGGGLNSPTEIGVRNSPQKYPKNLFGLPC